VFTKRNLGLAFVFLWFMIGGIAHFLKAEFFTAIMPPYIGFHREIVYISGVFEILGALGLVFPATRRVAGFGLFLLVICVSPANIHMWLHPELFPEVPPIVLSIRLVIQMALLWLIWWCTSAPAVQGAPDHAARTRLSGE
jgi:uncharacterized membrane protein